MKHLICCHGESEFVERDGVQLLLSETQSLRQHLGLEQQQGLGPHEGVELLELGLGEVVQQGAGHHAAAPLQRALQTLGLAQLLRQLLPLVLQTLLEKE